MPSFIQLTLADLLSHTGPKPLHRANNAERVGVKTRKNAKRFVYLVRAYEDYSNPAGHLFSFAYPNLIAFERLKNYPKLTPLNRRARVHCTCEAWKYWGSHYIATQEGYELLSPEDRPPDVRDPERQNWLCKHAVRVVTDLQNTTFPQLLSEFDSDGKKASQREVVAPFLREALVRDQWSDSDVDDALAGLHTDDDVEDFLEHQGFIVTGGPWT